MKKLHPNAVWLFFVRFLLSGLVFVFFALFFLTDLFLLLQFDVARIIIAAIILFVLWLIGSYFWAKLSYDAYRFEITEKSFKKEYGVIWKRYVSIPYERIQNVNISRGLLMRIIGLSSLEIQTAGYGSTGRRYFGFGGGAEGSLPGLSPDGAEQLREELINRAKGESGL